MYTAFYGLREKPFALSPDPRFLYLAESHREALAHLLYGLDQGEGFIVVSGEVGTGKTTLCRALLERLGPQTELAFLFNPSRNPHELLQSINEEFGLPIGGLSRRELLSRLNRFLLEKKRARRRVVLIVDEAQNRSPRTLEPVRLLSNLETNSAKLIQIVLLGQPELDLTLDSDELRQLRQRVSVRWSLAPLTRAETSHYVQHRLHVAAGAEREIFSDAALREVHRQSAGVPRRVNVLCDRTLLAGYAQQTHRIGPALVRRAAGEIPEPQRALPAAAPAARRRRLATAAATCALMLAFPVAWYAGLLAPAGERQHSTSASPPGVSVARAPTSQPAPPPVAAAASEARQPTSADHLQGEEKWLAVPGAAAPAGSLALVRENASTTSDSEPDSGSDDGVFLAALLKLQDARLARRLSLDALLARYGLPGLAGLPESESAIRARLSELGLLLVEVEPAQIETLRALDRPALLELRAADGSFRTAALLTLRDGVAELMGVNEGGGLLRVPEAALEGRWSGLAQILWRPLGAIPPLLHYGERGPGVLWLQSALSELGHLQPPPSGAYDEVTRAAVERFQRAHGLAPDGIAGPLTQMALDDALATDERPSLRGARRDEAAAG